jgi:glycosyltransferase involved in cell wall biosynthesis
VLASYGTLFFSIKEGFLSMKVSLVVPCYNEEENVGRLFEEIDNVLTQHQIDGEVVLVDDGSTDNTRALISQKAAEDPKYQAVIFRRNYGQTAAMVAGIDHAQGEVIIPLDADLQNDPADIPKLLEKLAEGYDVVSGWRKNRQDKAVSRKLPSMLANRLISKVGGVHIHDYGCTLKAYRKRVMDHVHLYGEMHRFIPIYAHWAGGKVTEIVVNHRPRVAGVSKYGIGRTFKVLLDLLTVKLLGSYATKPIYFFGGFGFLSFAGGTFVALTAVADKISSVYWNMEIFYNHRFSLLLVAVFMGLLGVQSIMLGLLAELQVRTYHETQDKPIYLVEEVVKDKNHGANAPLTKGSEACAELPA